MIIASWNIRGLNKPLKQREIRHLVSFHRINVLGILETKVKASDFKKVFSSCVSNWGFVNNYYYAERVEFGLLGTLVSARLFLF